ncbi:DarT ssDNA thymidine ADP-ribosyltransferase family protein [Enterobacter sp. Bisph1]|uniref:DarT ssDNA thymidine ADP-ribosyltransferase family protein n=1 Tax=Enterobacter sp. Bisph1 TaxID=1274399 RepID=UPI0009078FF6|nr:DarT ssDNA thymidine ADP-ribosyltransferase family protein [Enterobacter sp. Bisph1]
MTLQQAVAARNIFHLYHFTHSDNLSSILTKGLIGRQTLQDEKYKFEANDEVRLEGYPDALCLSISFPNAKMFFKCRSEKGGDWVILDLAPRILWEKDCSFYPFNAASSSFRSTDRKDMQGKAAFENLFLEPAPGSSRKTLNLTSEYPTDVQAEVLVFEPIESRYISSVYHPNKKSHDHFFNLHSTFQHRYYDGISGPTPTLYSQRHYYLG